MTVTPWGDIRELRQRRLAPGPGKDRAAVMRNQRERLLAGMVATVAERGYAATRVADVIEAAGISRNTFYRHFDNRSDCFVQALDAIVDTAETGMAAGLAGDGSWDERLRRYFETLVDMVVAQPAAARMCLVDAYVAGPQAVTRVDRMARASGRRALAVLEESPERANMPHDVARAVLGGLRAIVQTRLYSRRERELPDLVPQLMDWALSYRTPPAPLRGAERPRAAPDLRARHPADTSQQILDAAASVFAQRGYAATTLTEIANAAGVSLTTFYDRFDGKEAVFAAMLDHTMLRLLEVALPAYRAAEDWPHGVRDGLHALLSHVSADPATARFAAEAVGSGGPEVLTRLGKGMANFQLLLVEGLRDRGTSSSVTAEAIGSGILALAYDQVTRDRTERLYEIGPPAAYVALAPAIGAIEACGVVNGR